MEEEIRERLLLNAYEAEESLVRKVWTESKKLWVVAGPAIFTRITMFGLFVISQAFIGHIGNTEMAALSLVFHILGRFSIGVLMGMSSGLETLCGQAFGAKQYHMLGIYLQSSWLVELGVSVLIIPLFHLQRTNIPIPRPNQRHISNGQHNLNLVHPHISLLRFLLHPPNVPPNAEQEHDHHLARRRITSRPCDRVVGSSHEGSSWSLWGDGVDDRIELDTRSGSACVRVLWGVSEDLDGLLGASVLRSLAGD
ncbi:Protein TRANSPARENT TESTA 12 [Acorus calamus]|uniref:Protein TRANSPARENT TESTA 12 n=1 Tax=Acorus calamus TaxID=4465 RepID=A0AAV9CS62_ACOCL|nr:Protein TRANSPARENT TESTA 12 [Acorus calamus]